MILLRTSLRIIIAFTIITLFGFCDKSEEDVNSGDPYNLSVVLLSTDEENAEAVIQASGQNITQFHFFIDDDENAAEINQTGYFEYTFDNTDDHIVEVKAYGPSGRYVKSGLTVSFSPGQSNEVPLDKGYFSPMEYEGYTMLWQDEFNAGSINSQYWGYDVGNGVWGWGNNELEYYRPQNAWVTGDVLVIEARKENYGGQNYTSAKLKTKNKVSFKYGRIDIRALLPEGKGIWPALWLLGNNIDQVSWPDCGEIDIMEMVGGNGGEKTTHGTIHWENAGEHASYGGSKTLTTETFSDTYHVFSIIWDENAIKWYVDNELFHTASITGADQTEFHQEFWMILNVAVGGNWPGSPDATTVFPQQMRVDYIRVFQEQ